MSSGGAFLTEQQHNQRLVATATAKAALAAAVAANYRKSLISSTDVNTIINESEFPSLGLRSTPAANIINSGGVGGAITAATTSSNSSSSSSNSGTSIINLNNINVNNSSSNNNNNINSFSFTLPPTTSNSSSSPLAIPHNHLHTKDVYNVLQRAPYANLMRSSDGNSLSTGNVEFRMQNEDFPALPGATHNETGQIQAGNLEGVTSEARYTERLNSDSKPSIQTYPDGTVKNIPASMLNDQYGVAGLLTFLRAIETDPAIIALALGHDLTNLGLNLNSTDRNIYATFGGPWADYPCRIQDLEARVPDEYLTNFIIREKLPNIKLSKLSEDVLFYLFYNCPGEVYQVAAASELYSRDWRYHKGQSVWLTRSQYGGVKEQTSSYEKGSYNVFDPTQWRKIPKDMTLEYRELEERPKLPQSLQQSGQQAVQTPPSNASQNGS